MKEYIDGHRVHPNKKDKKLEIVLNDDDTISFSDYINTRIAYETLCQEKDKEIERLHSIIKEVREYIKNKQKLQMVWGAITLSKESQKELLEILDKEK